MSGVQLGLVGYGAAQSVVLTLGGMAMGLALGFLAGLAIVAPSRMVRGAAHCYAEVFRSVPVLVLAFWFVYALPALGFQLDRLFAGTLALALHGSGHAAAIVAKALRAVPSGQYDAAVALNFSPVHRALRIILPQALVGMMRPCAETVLEPLKASVVVAVVSISELTFSGQLIWRSNGRAAAIFAGLLVGYAVLALAFTAGMRALRARVEDTVGWRPARQDSRLVGMAR